MRLAPKHDQARHRGASRLFAITVASIIVAASCSGNTAVAPPTGVFPLRAIQRDQHVTVDVPASISTYGDDTVRYLAGDFELGPAHSWRERWERVLVSGGIEHERRVFESAGTYRISQTLSGLLILDLYPDMVIPANVSPTAILRGDTLSHSAFIFIR